MNKVLNEGLTEFLRATLEAISCFELEDYDKLEEMLSKRTVVIERLSEAEYSQEEFTALAEELELMKYDLILKKLLEGKQAEIRFQLGKLGTAKNAFNNYNKKNYVDSLYFSKKI